MGNDPIRAYLVDHEVGQHVIDGGLEGLVVEWARIASDVENDATWMWEEWVNDLDTRQLLHELLESVPEAADGWSEIETSDGKFRSFALATKDCAWGEVNAAREGWTPERNWWYWTNPPTPYEQ